MQCLNELESTIMENLAFNRLFLFDDWQSLSRMERKQLSELSSLRGSSMILDEEASSYHIFSYIYDFLFCCLLNLFATKIVSSLSVHAQPGIAFAFGDAESTVALCDSHINLPRRTPNSLVYFTFSTFSIFNSKFSATISIQTGIPHHSKAMRHPRSAI